MRSGISLTMVLVAAFAFLAGGARAQSRGADPAAGGAAHTQDAAALGAKLSNPVSDVWALFTEFDVYFSDGDLNTGDPEPGGRVVFQPVLPFPLYGSDEERWNLITRPIVPVLFSQPIPTGFDEFDHEGGLADIQLPMLVAPPTGRWLFGAGPSWLFPTSTEDAFGRQQ